jgi:hypothetical protein
MQAVADKIKPRFDPSTPRGLREMLMARYAPLKSERESLLSHWSDLSRHVMPRSFRAFSGQRNKGGRHFYNQIYDNTATRALRVFGAGMMAGTCSPARPWFRLRTKDQDLNDLLPVGVWLDSAVDRMQRVFASTNVYRVVHKKFEELGLVGNGASMIMPHPTKGVILHPFAVGEYCLAQDYEGNVNTCYREFSKSAGEIAREFGLDNCSTAVKQSIIERQHEREFRILHVVEPRHDEERNPDSPFAKDMPWRSTYLELGSDDDKILRDGGFDHFPILAPRWSVDGGDVYASTCPGMETLGDTRQLQQEQLRKGQAIDYQVRPPLQVPSSMKDRDNDGLPGGISYYDPGILLPFDQVTPNGGIRSAYEVRLDLNALLMDIQDVRQRIREGFFADLFLMLAQAGPNTRMTATEVAERHEEKLIMLGPALERLHNELLQPLIDITFRHMFDAGMFPPPPPELEGVDLSVEFVSILAQAQRAVGSNSYDRFMGNVMAIGAQRPDVLDNVNFDKWAHKYADLLGIDSALMVAEDDVESLRGARAQAEMANASLQASKTKSEIQKNLASSPTTGANALADVTTQLRAQAPAPEDPSLSPI